ncbi:right-handed parallel beta-helix repeat-containing protein [Verrucomicrobiaceae bacterium 5K15]|uniref:Right-handed parallel beta-helix repeat-containing protein n=1 Tax=Oceaniferula flava TaxID=2800421 RepID=A0AAE2VB28_9BACT|nr:right-handed parallel beta-helix repeat-containing protein [Oceaniferula flavus]MBK1854055.1 right-handed parallel beta-helix repeat-containing protein [Oceaniferula flavus]MBM1135361.1 right-handed parallel beta-helix repeat-containing protein [Oceaniferula flavus]
MKNSSIPPHSRRKQLLSSISLMLGLMMAGLVQAESKVTVQSLEELRQAVTKSDQAVVLAAGDYNLADLSKKNRYVEVSGSNNKIDLTGVMLEAPVGSTKSCYFRVTGDHNMIKGGTFEDTYENGLQEVKDFSQYNMERRKLASGLRGDPVVKVSGDHNQIHGLKLTVRGSFPYGYGSIYGIGRDNVFGLDKRCGILLTGRHNMLQRCEIQMRAFGHGIYMQAPADHSVIKHCYVEGRMRASKELYAETHAKDLPKRSKYRSDGRPIPRDVMLPLSEDGIRSYARSGHVTVENCRVKQMRGGVRLYLARSATVKDTIAIDCGATNFNMPKKGKVSGSFGNFSYAPLSDFRLSRSVQDLDITIIRSPEIVGPHNLADIQGDKHKIIFRRQPGAEDENLRPIVVTGKGSNIINATEYPIILESSSSGNTILSSGEVTDRGKNNKVTIRKP